MVSPNLLANKISVSSTKVNGRTSGALTDNNELLSPFRKTNKNQRKQRKTFLLMIFIPIFREITSCFRHFEKPIKTKENKGKHFVFICFYWFCLVFLDGESKYFKRRDAKPQSFFLFLRTQNARKKRKPSFILCFPCSE